MPTLVFSVAACQAPQSVDQIELSAQDSSFADILSDLHFADASVYTEALELNTEATSSEARDSILALHGLDEVSFMTLAEPLINEPGRLLAVYNLALDRAQDR